MLILDQKMKRAWWANFFGYFSRGPWVNRPSKRPEWHLVVANLFFKRPGGKEYNGLCSVEDWLFLTPLFKIVIYVSYSRNIRLQTFWLYQRLSLVKIRRITSVSKKLGQSTLVITSALCPSFFEADVSILGKLNL